MYRVVYSFDGQYIYMDFIEANTLEEALEKFRATVAEGDFKDLLAFSIANVLIESDLEGDEEDEGNVNKAH